MQESAKHSGEPSFIMSKQFQREFRPVSLTFNLDRLNWFVSTGQISVSFEYIVKKH